MYSPQNNRILIIDDSKTVLLKNRILLERNGFTTQTAETGTQGIEQAKRWQPHCILLDFYLPDMTAPSVVSAIRAFDKKTQIVLVTGRAADNPAREMLRRLDIQGYHDKGEGPEKLLVWVDAALKAYQHTTLIADHAYGMQQIIESSARIHRLRPLKELFPNALEEMAKLVAGTTKGRSNARNGFLATVDEDGEFVFYKGRGRFNFVRHYDELPQEIRKHVSSALEHAKSELRSQSIAIPLTRDDLEVGVFFFEIPQPLQLSTVHLDLFAQQISVAVENVHLYELATTDMLTRLHSRAHLRSKLLAQLKESATRETSLGLLCIDIDRLKPVNDTFGHETGDRLLRAIADAMRASLGKEGIVGRVGGDEFIVLLPNATLTSTRRAAKTVTKAIADIHMKVGSSHQLTNTASTGFGLISPTKPATSLRQTQWSLLANAFVNLVDGASYESKKKGGDTCQSAGTFSGAPMELLKKLRSHPLTLPRADNRELLQKLSAS